MPHLYPPAAPTLAGDNLTISRFLKSPKEVNREVRSVAQQRFIGDVLLKGRQESSGGAFIVETDESMYTSRAPEEVAPGQEYPRAAPTSGVAVLARTAKLGQDVPITDEAIGRQGIQPVNRTINKVVNFLVQTVDSMCLSAIGSAITQTQAASAAWSGGSASPFRDLELAKAVVRTTNQGYEPDVAVITDLLYAYFVSNPNVIGGLSREERETITNTGRLPKIADLEIMATPNLPAGTTALVLDTEAFGALGYERIPSPDYEGDPATGPETWIRRDPRGNDQWLLRGRRPVVPLIQEARSGCKITGA